MPQIAFIKIGGELLQKGEQITLLATEIATLQKRHQLRPLVLHGGGPQISAFSQRLSIAPRLKEGLRITSAAEIEVVEAVLSGIVNSRIVRIFNREGLPAVGLSAVSSRLLVAKPLSVDGISTHTAGEIISCNPQLLQHLLPHFLPVLSPAVADPQGRALNLNADQASLEIAHAMGAHYLFFLSGVEAVYDSQSAPIAQLNSDDIETLIAKGSINQGMALKARVAAAAHQRGIAHTYIGSCQKVGDLMRIMDGLQGTRIV